jgi:hypothetical protein
MGNGGGASGQAADLNETVRAQAEKLVGQPVVGDGECYALADETLKKAQAKSAPDFGKITKTADYAWGKEISDWKEVRAGDILQFRNHEIEVVIVKTVRKTFADGSSAEKTETDTQTFQRGHHTAIVLSNNLDGTMTVVDQHVLDESRKRRSKVVRKNELQVIDAAGKPQVETKTLKDPKKGQVKVETRTTRSVSVKGTIWYYRPVAAGK